MSEDIVKSVADGTIKPHMVAFMTHQELCPEKWQPLIDAKLKRDKNKFEVNIEASTDAFTCRKCKSKKCTYYQLQIRSADEGITTFVLCLDCNYKFRVN
jgi:transcription elongation factor S-II